MQQDMKSQHHASVHASSLETFWRESVHKPQNQPIQTIPRSNAITIILASSMIGDCMRTSLAKYIDRGTDVIIVIVNHVYT